MAAKVKIAPTTLTRKWIRVSFVLFAMALLTPGAAWSEDYEIRLHRPHHEGDTYNLVVTHGENSTVTLSLLGQPVNEIKKEFKIELDSTLTVLAVHTNGKVAKESHLINKLVRIEKGTSTEVLPKGTVVISSHNGSNAVFEIDGKSPDKSITDALAVVAGVERAGPTDDELFGTTERKRIGETWPINSPLLIQNGNQQTPGFVKEMSGKSTLEAVSKNQATIAMEMTAKVEPTIRNFEIKDGTMTVRATSKFPIDISRHKTEDNLQTSMTVTGVSQSMLMKLQVERSVFVQRSPAK